MKKILFITLALAISLSICAHGVSVSIDGIQDEALRSKIENNISRILTEANAAQEARRNLDFASMGLKGRVSESMAMLWENTPFTCPDEEIFEHCIRTGRGYQVRNIPLFLTPTDGETIDDEDKYQEAVISFDNAGNVESFYLGISTKLYMNVIKSNLKLTDERRRQEIISFVDKLKHSYFEKNIGFFEQFFSDDALIITGTVIQQKHGDGMMSEKIVYNKQSKKEYIERLKASFKRNKWIEVRFDSIDVLRHPKNPNFYGVTLRQGYRSSTYSDDGWVFLLWDFSGEFPQIHVRTWQPHEFQGKALPKEEIFSLRDFDI